MNIKTQNCISAANRIINRTHVWNEYRAVELGKPRIKITSRRLQKILYLCQLIWYIDHEESKMILEDFEAWPNGPVIPEIYNHWPVYHDGDLTPNSNISHCLTKEEENIINIVVDNTIDLSTEEIIDYIHSHDKPWKDAYKNSEEHSIITKDSIKEYIRIEENQITLVNFITSKTIEEEKTLTKKLIP